MRRRLKNRLLIGVAVVAVLAGVTAAAVMAAQPASTHHHHKAGALATATGYLGLSAAQLKSELRSGKSLAQIADATSGKSAAGLIEALEADQKAKLAAATANLPARITAEVDRPGGRSHAVAAAASYLGVSVAKLRAELHSGMTLAQIAEASAGKSQAGLIDALVAARKATLAAEVKAGTVTQAQANTLLAGLPSRVSARVNRVQRKHRARSRTAARGHRAGRAGARKHRSRPEAGAPGTT